MMFVVSLHLLKPGQLVKPINCGCTETFHLEFLNTIHMTCRFCCCYCVYSKILLYIIC